MRADEMLDARDPVGSGLPLNDAEVVAELHELRPGLAWCPELRCTVSPTAFDTFSAEQGDGAVVRAVLELNEARRVWAEDRAARSSGAEEKAAREMARHATRCCDSSRAAGIAGLFKALHAVPASALDREPTALGTPHGVVDMDTGRLCAEDGNDATPFGVTKRTGADVDGPYTRELAYDPRWDSFVDEICCGDAALAGYLQRALGYSLLGGNREECMFVAYGATTRNGKDTLLESVRAAAGDYAGVAERTFLAARRREGGADEALASLVGKRIVTISEPPRGMPLDEGKVKDLTACARQSTSRKFGAQFEFEPQFTIWMNVNNLPEVSDDSVFEGGRVRVVPFNRHFAPHERDRTLKARFATEDGRYTVLTWMLDGYLEYLDRGLDEPACVRDATDSYAGTGGSSLDRFVRTRCELVPGERTENNAFKEAYAAFCEGVLEEAPLGPRKMTRELARYGVSRQRSNGSMYWRGITLGVSEEAARVVREALRETHCGRGETDSGGGKRTGRIMLR